LQGRARLLVPTDWLAHLFSSREGGIKSAAGTETTNGYLSQSCYYNGDKWDIPQGLEADADAICLDEESDEESDEDLDVDGDELRQKDPWKSANECLQQRFMDIFNDIFYYFGLGKARKALATESTDDEYDDVHYRYEKVCSRAPHFSTRMDIAILGEDTRQLPRPLDSYSRGMSVDKEERRELYRGCVAVAKVQKVSRGSGSDRMLEKVATAAEYVTLSSKVRV